MTAPMRSILKVGHAPHPIDRKRYGTPRFALFWAGARFTKPGLWVWVMGRNIRVLPVWHKRSGASR